MKVKFLNKGNTLIASIIGEMDHHTADYIRDKIDGEIIKSSTKNIVFDFSKVGFMDSSGIGLVMGRYKNISKLNGRTAIIKANEQVRRIFEMSGVVKLVPIYDNIDEAIGS
ncbi:anti-sigma F factor antagonist [Pseudobacteroides cellulosolvens]|uniref:Anti-sigma F factor antagonist n=1 Tax=Pseudobacteroides cellulosolvens ATCC 35603 = DSM 2933 TaxID=398512 RepID=A0A0L6JT44_9FIRM|nr:anti-sigma F factor antagonist [Pseudobacteroides cellulosolvens]KNY28592.1 anti-sigma-factor antagonist [Pseudobacteroides cellulosolvens ATCC 35603 = DSM 2933]